MRTLPWLLFLLLLHRGAAAVVPVAVSVLPQKTFVKAVGDGAVRVEVMVGKGFDPATWQAGPRRLQRLAKARLYVRAGLPFERSWVPRLKRIAPEMVVLDMRDDATPLLLGNGERDPHVWTDPLAVKAHAARLRDVLSRIDPGHRHLYSEGCAALAKRLDALHQELSRRLAPLKGRSFLVFHPAWGHFARRYGLRQLAVEHEGKAPAARSLARLIDEAKKRGIRTVIVQPQHNSALAQVVARALGGRVVEVDPLSEDYFAALRRMAEVLEQDAS